MARGAEHLGVKQTLIENVDEVFVVSPLGKIFVGYSSEAVNLALGYSADSYDPDRLEYRDVRNRQRDCPTS